MEKSFEFAENVVGFMVKSEIDQEKIEEILEAVKQRIKKISPICLYLEDQNDDGASFGGFMEILSFHFSHSKDLDKIAVVTDDKLFQKSMDFKDLIVPAKVKTFDRKERMKAMNWVME